MPTIKAKRAFIKMVENGGNVGKAMIDAGYSKAMAKNPQKLTNSKGWEELKAEFLPDDLLLKTHLEGLQADKWITPHDAPNFKDADYATRAKFLDMAYKAKGNYAAEKSTNTNINIEELKVTIQNNLATFRANSRGTTVLPESSQTV